MPRQKITKAMLCISLFAGTLAAQTPSKVDFGRDVLPLLRQNCIGCHGPAKQMNSYRLDRRSVALRGPAPVIVPGYSAASRLYLRLTGSEFGSPMPPSGPLKPEDAAVIKAWIDQGAPWPDELANEADLPPVNPKAVAMTDALRAGDRQSFMKLVAEDPKLLNARGPEGSTPFMYAVLYSDAGTLRQLLQKGADPNKRNDANATALMWAATDFEKTRVLLESGADVNARSNDGRTPLFVSTTRHGAAPVVKLLLDRGADPKVSGPSLDDTPFVQAAAAGDAEVMQLLIDRGAETKVISGITLVYAVATNCSKCIDLAAKNMDATAHTYALLQIAAFGDVSAVRFTLDHGADVNAADPMGRTVLMYAAVSDLLPLDEVKLLLERGASVNAKSHSGQTALDIAKLHGDTPIVALLMKSGATAGSAAARELKLQHGNTVQAAVQRSLSLLQRADASFTQKTGCVSCHNESLPAMAVSLARKNGFKVDEQTAGPQVKANVAFLAASRERMRQGISFVPMADPDILSYILIGLHGEQYKPDENTDTIAMHLKTHQMPDGRWAVGPASSRPPLCPGDITQTALTLRALQLFAPNIDKAGYEKSIQLAAAWLAKAQSRTGEDRAWRLLGLAWAGKDKDAIHKAMRELLATQRSDGAWSDIATLPSGAYATGQALVALQAAGLDVSDTAYQRGVKFLLNTQLEDGSWYVKTRALGFQPYFDNGFPHGTDQWISGAATSWATMALTLASSAPRSAAASAGVQ